MKSNVCTKPSTSNTRRPVIDLFKQPCVPNIATRGHSKRYIASQNSRINKKKPGRVRVGCPFHKMNPKTYQAQACKGKGFEEMAKLKDHMKDVHGISQDRCDSDFNFKTAKYTQLKTIERKWGLVVQTLFPGTSQDQIPSPYANEADTKVDSDVVNLKVKAKIGAFKNLLIEKHGQVIKRQLPGLLKEIEVYLEEVTKDLSPGSCGACLSKHRLDVGSYEAYSRLVDHHDYLSTSDPTDNPPQTRMEDEGYHSMCPVLSTNFYDAPPQLLTSHSTEFNADTKPVSATRTTSELDHVQRDTFLDDSATSMKSTVQPSSMVSNNSPHSTFQAAFNFESPLDDSISCPTLVSDADGNTFGSSLLTPGSSFDDDALYTDLLNFVARQSDGPYPSSTSSTDLCWDPSPDEFLDVSMEFLDQKQWTGSSTASYPACNVQESVDVDDLVDWDLLTTVNDGIVKLT